jgi:hypothetical protein
MRVTAHNWRLLTTGFVLWLFCAVCLATAAKAGPKPLPDQAAIAAAQTASPFAIADFDGDSRLDIATVQVGELGSSETHYWINFELSTARNQLIPLTAPIGGLSIAPRDVNGDNFLDLIITTAWQHRPVAVLLNDGRGNFTLSDPGAFSSRLWDPQTFWTPALATVSDGVAAMLSRNSSGPCESAQGIAVPHQQGRSLAPSISRQAAVLLVGSVLGRAPPFRSPHI